MKTEHKTLIAFGLLMGLAFIAYMTPIAYPCPRHGKTILKWFYYEKLNPELFSPNEQPYPIGGLYVDVKYDDHTWRMMTDQSGLLKLEGVPSGEYLLNWTWNGEPDRETLSICCAKRVWEFKNYLPPK